MSRSLPYNFVLESAKAVTTPGYLVEIAFTSPLRLSSRGDVQFNSGVFIKWGVDVAGLSQDGGKATLSGTLSILDTDNTVGTLVLGQGVMDRKISVWAFYGNGVDDVTPLALPNIDAYMIFQGYGDGYSIDPSTNKVSITLQAENSVTMFGPRTYLTPANGFNFAPAAGTTIYWGAQAYVLNSDRG